MLSWFKRKLGAGEDVPDRRAEAPAAPAQARVPEMESVAGQGGNGLFQRLKEGLTTERYRPYSVTVCETENCCVTYREG